VAQQRATEFTSLGGVLRSHLDHGLTPLQ